MSPERARPGSPAVVYVTSPGLFSARIRANASVMRDAIRRKTFHHKGHKGHKEYEPRRHRATEALDASGRQSRPRGQATERMNERPIVSPPVVRPSVRYA